MGKNGTENIIDIDRYKDLDFFLKIILISLVLSLNSHTI